ncbi:ribbon-helix-helix protein, CopG family [Halomicrobium sp. IBSBa]|uniref:Ribbon-helix-helix protein, CopG family n=1 Tax=Halomicrobium mukohataei TaxID=57705 RepID=A0A847UC58_9EURY|nr:MULTISPECIES: ribbon-helix-helix protein, CopG family [Halomicrobium]MBO4247381.1 ribbon-helix-helix protein, CopG family [Halomicrobium sp. IBSBa]NLV08668.1 ribbon-helix-helix protein, CopG family [Halomicrobium mukohataei]
MDEAYLDLEAVELELDEELLDAIDEKAFAEHRDNREAAIRDLLDEWLKERDGE